MLPEMEYAKRKMDYRISKMKIDIHLLVFTLLPIGLLIPVVLLHDHIVIRIVMAVMCLLSALIIIDLYRPTIFSGDLPLPAKKDWVTLMMNAGKRDKISKADVVGFLIKKGRLQKDELGIVEIMHRQSFAAVKRDKVQRLLKLVANETIKRKQVSVSISY